MGRIFRTLAVKYPELEVETFSANRFSMLRNAELVKIIKALKFDEEQQMLHNSFTVFNNYILWSRELKAKKLWEYCRDNI